MRTGLAALAIGLAAERFMGEVLPPWIVRGLAVVLLGFSALSFFAGSRRLMHLEHRIARQDAPRLSPMLLGFVNGILIVAALAAMVGLWLV
jgi:uncharacterized membrane protein YidH (DUF202 family)